MTCLHALFALIQVHRTLVENKSFQMCLQKGILGDELTIFAIKTLEIRSLLGMIVAHRRNKRQARSGHGRQLLSRS